MTLPGVAGDARSRCPVPWGANLAESKMFTNVCTRLSSLLVIATLSACGAETKSNPEATTDSTADKAAEAIEPVAKAPDTATPPTEAPKAVSGAPLAYLQALYLADAGSRPVCAAANEGQLVYLVGAKEFQACAAGQWQVVDLRGPQGLKGEDGVDGQSSAIVSRQYCSKNIASDLTIRSVVSVMANGDVHSSCEASDSWRSIQSSSLLSVRSFGASSGENGCTVTYDADGVASSGWWDFKTVGSVRQATYRDTASTLNGNVYQFAAEECTTTVY